MSRGFLLLLMVVVTFATAGPVSAQIASCGPGQSGSKSSYAGGAGAVCVASCPVGQIQTPRGSAGECCLKANSSNTDPCVGVGGGNILDSVACPGHGVSSFFANRVFACQCVGPANIRTDNTLGSACVPRANCPVGSIVEFSGGRDAYCNRAPASSGGDDTDDDDTDDETPAGGGGGGDTGGGLFSTISGWTAGLVGGLRTALGWALDLFTRNIWPYIRDAMNRVGATIGLSIILVADGIWDAGLSFILPHVDWIILVLAGILSVWILWNAFGQITKKVVGLGMDLAYRFFLLAGVSSVFVVYVLTLFFTALEDAALGSDITSAAFSSVFRVGYSSGPLQALLAGMYEIVGTISPERAAILSASHAGFMIYMLHLFWIGPGLKILFLALFLRFLLRRFVLTVQLAGR